MPMERNLGEELDNLYKKIAELMARVHYLERYCPETAVIEARETAKIRADTCYQQARGTDGAVALEVLEEQLEEECQNTK